MRSSNKIKSIVYNLCTLIGIWLIFSICALLLKTQKTELYKHIPNNFDFYGEVNNQLITKKIANELLIDSPNDSLFVQFSELLQKINETPSKITGINFFSNIVFFKATINDKPIISVLFDLVDPEQFKKIKLSETFYTLSKDHTGILLLSLEKEQISKSKLHQIALNVFKNTNDLQIKSLKKDEIFCINFKNNKNQLSIFNRNNGISITGKIQDTKTRKNDELLMKNSKSNFNLTANHLPNYISNFLQEKLNQQLYNTPIIKGLSISYKGLEIKETEEDDFSIIPQINAHILFDSCITQKRILKTFEPISKISIDTLTNSFTIGEEKYAYKLSKKHLYFGENTLEFQTRPSQNLFQLNGKLASIFKIKGPSFITGFIEMLPPYFISKKYANSFHNVQINVQKNNPNSIIIVKGKIKMKDKKNLYHETLKMILDFQSTGL